jgi:hypothetical protein
MSFLNDRVLDNGLQALTDEADRLDICSALPPTYLAATSTFSLGNRLAPTVSAPAARSPSGREVTIAAFADGLGTADGTAAYWALVDTVNSRLLAAGEMDEAFAITIGAPFSITDFTIGIPGPA